MTPEALELCSRMTGRSILSWRDLSSLEIEALLNMFAKEKR